MKIKDVAVLVGIVGAGVLIMSKWDEIKGFFGDIAKGFGDWGIGPEAPERPPETPPWVPPAIPPYIRPDLPPGYHGPPLPDIMPIPPPSFIDFLFPPIAFLPDEPQEVPFMPMPPPAPTIPESIFPPIVVIRPFIDLITPVQPSPQPISPPTYTPTVPPVYQPGPVVPSDPGHPSTDPFRGGR